MVAWFSLNLVLLLKYKSLNFILKYKLYHSYFGMVSWLFINKSIAWSLIRFLKWTTKICTRVLILYGASITKSKLFSMSEPSIIPSVSWSGSFILATMSSKSPHSQLSKIPQMNSWIIKMK